jgi:hypothetical protein
MMLKRVLATVVCALILTTTLPRAVVAQGNGKGKGHNKHADQSSDDDRDSGQGGVRVVFSVRDRDAIRSYYHDRYANLPPGLAKRNGNLPPGLQKHLERDGTLPPGLQKRVEPFPEELERRLTRLPDSCQRVTLGVDVLILDRRTQRIVDIIHDILRP